VGNVIFWLNGIPWFGGQPGVAEVVALRSEEGTVDRLRQAPRSTRRGGGAGPGPGPEEGRNPDVDFHKQKRSNETHASTKDPDARLAKKGKGKEAKLSYQGNVLMEIGRPSGCCASCG